LELVEARLVSRKAVGAQTLYSANEGSPVFREIKSLVTKTVGMHDVLVNALAPLRDDINLAFVYGSVARSREREHSDVDLMVVGKVDFDEVVNKLLDAEKTLNREINPTVYSIKEFSKKLRGNFLKSVLAEKKLFIIGDEDELETWVKNIWLERRDSDCEEIGRLLSLADGRLEDYRRAVAGKLSADVQLGLAYDAIRICHFHGPLWKRVSQSHSNREDPFGKQEQLLQDGDTSSGISILFWSHYESPARFGNRTRMGSLHEVVGASSKSETHKEIDGSRLPPAWGR
jgi:predicted nucleotidyltransferase